MYLCKVFRATSKQYILLLGKIISQGKLNTISTWRFRIVGKENFLAIRTTLLAIKNYEEFSRFSIELPTINWPRRGIADAFVHGNRVISVV